MKVVYIRLTESYVLTYKPRRKCIYENIYNNFEIKSLKWYETKKLLGMFIFIPITILFTIQEKLFIAHTTRDETDWNLQRGFSQYNPSKLAYKFQIVESQYR